MVLVFIKRMIMYTLERGKRMTTPCKQYVKDVELDILTNCTEEQLAVLVNTLAFGDDGKPRVNPPIFKSHFEKLGNAPEKFKDNWQYIAAEIQHCGGDSLANVCRGTGVLYKEILLDVLNDTLSKQDREKSIDELEQTLLCEAFSCSPEEILERSWAFLKECMSCERIPCFPFSSKNWKEWLPSVSSATAASAVAVGGSFLGKRMATQLLPKALMAVGIATPVVTLAGGVATVAALVSCGSGPAVRITRVVAVYIAALRQVQLAVDDYEK